MKDYLSTNSYETSVRPWVSKNIDIVRKYPSEMCYLAINLCKSKILVSWHDLEGVESALVDVLVGYYTDNV